MRSAAWSSKLNRRTLGTIERQLSLGDVRIAGFMTLYAQKLSATRQPARPHATPPHRASSGRGVSNLRYVRLGRQKRCEGKSKQAEQEMGTTPGLLPNAESKWFLHKLPDTLPTHLRGSVSHLRQSGVYGLSE